MHISLNPTPTAKIVVPADPAPGAAPVENAWTNPAAAAALKSSVQMLRMIEDGIVKNISDIPKIRSYASDLRSTTDTLLLATESLQGDAHKENDSFLPLITRASNNVAGAEARITAKNFAAIWPSERADILSSLRFARVMSDNVATQLDPSGR